VLVNSPRRAEAAGLIGVALALASPVLPVALCLSVLSSTTDRSVVLVVPILISMLMYVMISTMCMLRVLIEHSALRERVGPAEEGDTA
jgi:hypothetical protein